MSPGFPFQELLLAAREAGLPVSVTDHLALARLVARYDGTSRAELRAAVCALLARDDADVRRLEALFDERFPEAAPDRPPPLLPARTWMLLVVLAAAVAGLVIPSLIDGAIPSGPITVNGGGSVDGGTVDPPPIDDAPASIAQLPPPLPLPNLALGGGVLGTALMVLLGLVGLLEGRRRREGQLDLRQRKEGLPGPRRYELRTDLPVPSRQSLHRELAALLGAYRGELGDRDLDVKRTVERTAQAGMAPVLVYAPRAVRRPLTVLVDVAPEMAPWRPELEALLRGLEAEGVQLERWLYRRSVRRVFRTQAGPREKLERLAARDPDAPLLVFGTGDSLDDPSASEDLRALELFARRTLLCPIREVSRWPRGLRRQTRLPAWPMTRAGMLSAAWHLARGQTVRVPPPRFAAVLNSTDALLLQGLLSYAPSPTFELAELVRRHFMPRAPEDVLAAAAPVIHPPVPSRLEPEVEEARRWLKSVDHDGAMRASALELFLQVMDGSEPLRGSMAHLRWQLDRALLQAQSDDAGQVSAAKRELESLASTALGDEAIRTTRACLAIPGPLRQGLASQLIAARAAPPARPFGAWKRPTLLFSIGALAGAALTAMLAALANPAQVAPRQAWKLEPSDGLLIAYAIDRDAPRFADLLHNGRIIQTGIDVSRDAEGPTRLPVNWADGDQFHLLARAGPLGRTVLASNVWTSGREQQVQFKFTSSLDRSAIKDVAITLTRGSLVVTGTESGTVMLTPGEWRLMAEASGYTPISDTIELADDDDPTAVTLKSFVFPMSAETGELDITGLPSGVVAGDVSINGKPWSGAPVRITGDVEVSLTSPIHSFSRVVRVEPGKREELDLSVIRPEFGVITLSVPRGSALTRWRSAQLVRKLAENSTPRTEVYMTRGRGRGLVDVVPPAGDPTRNVVLDYRLGEYGLISVRSTTGAVAVSLQLDPLEAGVEPTLTIQGVRAKPDSLVRVSAGQVEITATAPGYQPASVQLTVGAGALVKHSLVLKRETGVRVSFKLGSRFRPQHVRVDGQPWDGRELIRLPGATLKIESGHPLTRYRTTVTLPDRAGAAEEVPFDPPLELGAVVLTLPRDARPERAAPNLGFPMIEISSGDGNILPLDQRLAADLSESAAEALKMSRGQSDTSVWVLVATPGAWLAHYTVGTEPVRTAEVQIRAGVTGTWTDRKPPRGPPAQPVPFCAGGVVHLPADFLVIEVGPIVSFDLSTVVLQIQDSMGWRELKSGVHEVLGPGRLRVCSEGGPNGADRCEWSCKDDRNSGSANFPRSPSRFLWRVSTSGKLPPTEVPVSVEIRRLEQRPPSPD